MSSAAVIEQARAMGMVLFYDAADEIYTWAPKGTSRDRRQQLTRLLQAQYFEVLTLLKLAVLEHA